MKILVTGVAGFIGYSISQRLISEGYRVFGIDNMNNYYDINLKKERLKRLFKISKNNKTLFDFKEASLEDGNLLFNVFEETKVDYVINLAAQAGVRYSIENPNEYIQSNLVGFCNILECLFLL